VSGVTAEASEAEVRSIIDAAYAKAKKILEDHLDILHKMKDALMKYETIDALQIDDLMNGREVRPPKDWDDHNGSSSMGSSSKDDEAGKKDAKGSSDSSLGGTINEV